jgi:guanine deaminase
LYGHSIYLDARIDRLLVICRRGPLPDINTFIGSGLFDMAGLKAAASGAGGLAAGLRFQCCAHGAAYEMRNCAALRTCAMMWRHRRLRVGAAHVGTDRVTECGRDGAVLNLASTCNCAISPRQFPQGALFPVMMGDDRAMAAVYVAEKAVWQPRPSSTPT